MKTSNGRVEFTVDRCGDIRLDDTQTNEFLGYIYVSTFKKLLPCVLANAERTRGQGRAIDARYKARELLEEFDA